MDYRDFINTNMNDVITALNGSITPAPVNSELYRDFLNRKADDVITALNGSITPAPAGDELYRDFIERKFDDVIAGIGGYVPPVTFPTVSGAICTFNSAVAGLPLKSHTIALTATQSGSGTPSPVNVRNIDGYSAINIANASEDLYHDITVQNGYLSTEGEVRASGVSSVTDYIPVVEGLVYYYYDYVTAALSPRNICIYDDSKQFVSYISYETVNKKAYFSIPSNGAYVRITIDRNYTNQHLYNGTAYLIQIGSTVYGGEYDARTGLFKVTYKYFSFDYTSSWAHEISGGGHNFYIACPSDIKTGQWAGNSNMMCSASPISTYFGAQKDHCFISNGRNFNYTWGDTLVISTAQGFKDYLQANNIVIEVVAQLITPITIQLPPCPIDTLEGVNNIFADTGDTTLQYIKMGGNT